MSNPVTLLRAPLALACALVLALAGILAVAPAAGAAPPRKAHRSVAPALSAPQQHYLALAEAGVARAQQRWRDKRLGWDDSRLHDHARYPLATIWDIVPLFQSLDAIAIASPTASHLSAVKRFATGAE